MFKTREEWDTVMKLYEDNGKPTFWIGLKHTRQGKYICLPVHSDLYLPVLLYIRRNRDFDTTFSNAAGELVWIDGTAVISQNWMGTVGVEFNEGVDCMYLHDGQNPVDDILHDKTCWSKELFLCQI